MIKNEFLVELRTSLTGELPDIEVETNIRFYDDYIESKGHDNNEESIMEQLGDPRLIAKTIIETYQISHGPHYKNIKNENVYEDVNTSENTNYENQDSYNNHKSNVFHISSSLKWYQKLLFSLAAIIIIVLLIVIGGILLRLFFSIGIPLLIVYMGYKVIRNNTRR